MDRQERGGDEGSEQGPYAIESVQVVEQFCAAWQGSDGSIEASIDTGGSKAQQQVRCQHEQEGRLQTEGQCPQKKRRRSSRQIPALTELLCQQTGTACREEVASREGKEEQADDGVIHMVVDNLTR